MAEVTIDRVSKTYPNGYEAIHETSLEVVDGEFLVLVGPSGSGKTTLLRMIAGLEDVTSGSIVIGGKDVTGTPPEDRDIAMVFQSYALYPSMTVRGNLGFGLRMRKVPKGAMATRVEEVAQILGLTAYLDRRPGQLSGGQRQRVAMGRAMVREPSVYLMDEPLSNLDAKLRGGMRAELAKLHQRLGVTTIYVTHDQVEATTLGDRVAVLTDAALQQCSTPKVLYDHPVNVFVASFIGTPSMNLLRARRDGEDVIAGELRVRAGEAALKGVPEEFVFGFRPTDIYIDTPEIPNDWPRFEVTADVVEEMGSDSVVTFSINAEAISVSNSGAVDVVSEEERILVEAQGAQLSARLVGRLVIGVGQRLKLAIDRRHLYFFDVASGEAINGVR